MVTTKYKYHKIKSDFLGLNYGTACHRLRKTVLFSLLKRLGENSCYRCRGEIVDIDSLSLEHKESWLYVDPELFWDLDNIAFSHLSCNVKASRNPFEKNCPEGTSWCQKCRECYPVENFYPASGKKKPANGLKRRCKKCCNVERVEQRRRKRNGV